MTLSGLPWSQKLLAAVRAANTAAKGPLCTIATVEPSAQLIRIAGAGPAGLSCAIALARRGRRAIVSEARATVGARFTGDLQVLEDFSEEADVRELLDEIGIEGDFLGPGLTQAELFDAKLRRTRVSSTRPFAHFLKRGPEEGTLDSSLLRQARASGVEVRFGERREPEEVDVAATGPRVPDGLAREMTFRTESPDRVQVLFDSMRAPGGYGYFFAQGGYATLGCAVVRDLKRIDRCFEMCAKRFREIADYSVSEERTGYSYMNFAIPETERSGSTLLAGEAGGFQDYLFGLGIRYAMTTGLLAAISLVEGKSYDALWEERVGAKRRSSLGARLLYEGLGDAGLAAFARRGGRRDFRNFLKGWSRPSFAKEALAVAARALWRRPENCRHALPDHWCRGRESRDLPAQGPAAPPGGWA